MQGRRGTAGAAGGDATDGTGRAIVEHEPRGASESGYRRPTSVSVPMAVPPRAWYHVLPFLFADVCLSV